MTDRARDSRRRFLRLAGTAAVVGVAGCAGGSGGGSGDGGGDESGDAGGGTGAGTEGGGDQQSGGDLPDEYVTATAQDGTERSPDSVATKEAVMYQSEPKDGQQCTDCRFYIPDKNDDGLGACAVVEGTIEPQAWCSSYVEYEG